MSTTCKYICSGLFSNKIIVLGISCIVYITKTSGKTDFGTGRPGPGRTVPGRAIIKILYEVMSCLVESAY